MKNHVKAFAEVCTTPEYNGTISILKLMSIIKSIRGMFKVLQTLSYTVHSIFLPKFPTFVLSSPLLLDMPAIILQTPCCHAGMTSKIPPYRSPLRVSLNTCTIL